MAVTHLIPGFALDGRAFHPLDLPPERFRFRDLIPAEPRESFPRYAARVADAIGFHSGDAVGGLSMGGMLALEIARQRGASRILLLSGCTHPSFIRPAVRGAGRLARWTPEAILHALFLSLPALLRLGGMHTAANAALLREILGSFPPPLLRRLPGMILDWEGCEPAAACFALHSENDWVVRPPRHLSELELLPGNGHLITLTQPRDARRFLLSRAD